jgi:hypothetical protein
VSPLLFSVTSQHNIPHTSLDGGGGYANLLSISNRGRRGGGLLHLRPREAQRRSTLSPAEGGVAEVFFNSGLVLQIRDGGLKYHRYITMPSGSL